MFWVFIFFAQSHFLLSNENMLDYVPDNRASTIQKIKVIQKEYKKINTSPLKEITLDKEQLISIYVDDKNRIRKFSIKGVDSGNFPLGEYFNENGELIFLYFEGLVCGSGVRFQARIYFWKGKIIRNICQYQYDGNKYNFSLPAEEFAPYHLNTKKIIKEYQLNF